MEKGLDSVGVHLANNVLAFQAFEQMQMTFLLTIPKGDYQTSNLLFTAETQVP